jgi:hypothetical protein
MNAIYSIIFGLVLAYLAFGGARQLFKPAAPKNPLVHYETKKVSPSNDEKPVKRVYEY